MDSPQLSDKVRTSVRDAISFSWFEEVPYDKVLADVPCTTDRVSVTVEENNIFSTRRAGERHRLPQLQMDILMYGRSID